MREIYISPYTFKTPGFNLFTTSIITPNCFFEAIAKTENESRLNAVKLAMLLAINESERLLKQKTAN